MIGTAARLIALALWLCLVVQGPAQTPAPTTPADAAATAMQRQPLRRIYVPADGIESEVRGLWPLSRAEFERRMRRFERTATPAAAPPGAIVSSAVYRGSLRGEHWTQGTAELTIERQRSPRSADETSWLVLAPCNLALGSPVWKSEAEEGAAAAATWGNSDKQQLLLAVERDGVLQFSWSARGRRDERGRVKFVLDLPPAVQQRLELRVPANLQLSSDQAVVRRVSEQTAPLGKPADGVAESLWQVEAAGGQQLELLVQPRQAEESVPARVLVRETGSYVFTAGQVDLDLSLELDIDRAPLKQIRVRHDPRLQWTAVRWGEQNLAWTSETTDSEPVAVINFPEALTGASRLIQLTAVADWSPSAQAWQLPRVTVEDALWQEGRLNIAAPRWLQLDATASGGARLSATTLASEGSELDHLQFQLERISASIAVQSSVQPQQIDATSLLSLQVEPKQLVANLAAELSIASGSLFTVECEIPRAWVLDSIETAPADLLEDRTTRSRGNLQVVTLQLKQPLRGSKPLRLHARLRHVRGTSAEAWGDDILQPVRFLAAASSQRYVALQLADASFEPKLLSAAGLEFLSPAELSAKVKSLSDAPLGNWLVRLTDNARQPRMLLAPGSPRYAADLALVIQLAEQRADYRLQVKAEPESSAVSSILVQIRPAPASNPIWRLGGDERPLTAERVETMMAAGDQPGPALYRVELPRARDVGFVLHAEWSEPLLEPTYAPLAELPEASTNSAQVEIVGPLDFPFTWQAHQLRPLPIPVAARKTRARYRYQAGQEARLQISPLVESQRPAAGWISRCDVDSEFSPTGAGRHEARYLIVGDDVQTLELRLPDNARLARAVVDGNEVLAFSRASDPRWLSIPLRNGEGPAPRSSTRVRIEYTSPATSSSGWLTSRWTAPIPEPRLPVLQSFWQAQLPGYWKLWPEPGIAADIPPSGARTRLPENPLSALLQTALWPENFKSPILRDLPATAQIHINVYSPTWFGLIALFVLFLAASVGLWLTAWNAFRFAAAGAILLAISLLLPEPWQAIGQAALAGWLLGFALQLFRRPVKSGTSAPATSSTGFVLQPITRLWLLSICLGLLMISHNDARLDSTQLRAAEQEPGPQTWKVVIPVDAEGQATNYVYVSEPLYVALFRSEVRTSGDQPASLLRSAQYELRWDASMAEAPPTLQGFVARYEVDVLQERTTLSLPFIREQLRLIEPGVKIDGETGAGAWTADGDALQIELTGPGRKSIEIGMALATLPKDGTAGAQIHIPAVTSSRLLVPTLTSNDVVTIATARGAGQSTGAAWQVELGATDLLSVQWSRTAAEPAPVIEAEQLLLWRLRPSSVVVEGKWQFRPLSGKLREVVLRADPRFRLLPTGNGAGIVRQWTEEGDTNLHHFVLDRLATADTPLTASFLLVGSTGIGNLAPPRLEPVADRVARDWQAAWIAPGLQWGGKPGTMPPAEFLQVWGDQSLAPVQAFRSTAESPRPTLAVSAVQSRLQAEQQIEWSLAADQTHVRYVLQGAQYSTDLSQFRFQLPAQFTIRRVAVLQNDSAVASRWFRHADGLLTVLVDEPRAEPWIVEVQADRPNTAGRLVSLPVLQALDIDVQRYTSLLRRRSGAAALLGKLSGWKQVTGDDPSDAAVAERIVAQLEWQPARAGAVPPAIPVTISGATTELAGELLTRLVSVEDRWRIEVLANLRSPSGTFEELQLTIPRDWEGPFELDPPGSYQVELLPGQSRNLLRIQMSKPAGRQLQLRLSGALVTEQELIRLPVIDLVGVQENLQRWVALPRRGSDSPLQWQTAGLQLRPELPASLGQITEEDELIYEAIIDRYRASARPERARREQPRIVLADNHVVWQADRRIVGRSELTVLPGGARTLLIQPPPAHELVAVIVNERPGQLRWEPGIGGAATIELHSDTWPQWVQVIYRGRLAASGDASASWEFAAPRIPGAPVERTRWQIAGPTALQLPAALPTSNAASVDDALAPFEALVRVAQGAAETPAGNHAESASTWLAVWRQHWDREMAAIRKRAPSSLLAPVITARLQALEHEMSDQLTLPVTEPASDAPPAQDASAAIPVREAASHSPHELRYGAAGELETLVVLRTAPLHSAGSTEGGLMALGLLILAAAIAQLGRTPSLRDWLIAHPQLVLALCGAAAVLIPGYLWLGCVLLASTLFATLHSPWQARG